MKNLEGYIEALSTAPDTHLDAHGARLCAEWNGEDPVRFIRDLLDLSVRYAWGSSFTITSMQLMLSAETPETEEEAEARRAELLAKWEPT